MRILASKNIEPLSIPNKETVKEEVSNLVILIFNETS